MASSSSVSGVSEMPTEPCEVCSTDEQFVRATVFCVDCNHGVCERCSWPCKKRKGRAHHVRPLDGESVADVEKDVQELKLTGKLQFLIMFRIIQYYTM